MKLCLTFELRRRLLAYSPSYRVFYALKVTLCASSEPILLQQCVILWFYEGFREEIFTIPINWWDVLREEIFSGLHTVFLGVLIFSIIS